MAAPSLVELARDLLRRPPSEFVARRNELAKELKAAGDKQLAAEVAALRRVGVSDWALDVVAADDPEVVGAFVAACAAVGAAQDAALAGRRHDLRGATKELRAATAALAERASTAAGDHGVTGAGSSAIELGLHLAAVAGDAAEVAALSVGLLGLAELASTVVDGDRAGDAATSDDGGDVVAAAGATSSGVPSRPFAPDPQTRRRSVARRSGRAADGVGTTGASAEASRSEGDDSRARQAAERRDRAADERAHRELASAAARHLRQLRQAERLVADAEIAVAAARAKLATSEETLAAATATRDDAATRQAEFARAVDDSAARLASR